MRSGGMGRAVYALASQGANSAGNMLLAVAVARGATTAEFGAWSVGYAGYMVALVSTRALAATPLLLLRADSPGVLIRWIRGAGGLALVIGCLVGPLLVAPGLVFAKLLPSLLAFAVCLPALLFQDVMRHGAFAASRSRDAAALDLAWLATQGAAFVWLVVAGATSAPVVTLAWGTSCLPAVAVLVLRRRLHPSFGLLAGFWARARPDGVKLLADNALATLATQALPVVVAASVGLAAAGALRGALTLMGAVNIVVAGLTPIATLAARRRFDASGRIVGFVLQWSSALFVVGLVNGAVLWIMPDPMGRQVLGATWATASGIILPLVLHSLMRGPFTGIPIALQASDRVSRALTLRMWTTVPTVLLPWGGALWFGLSGAVWGIALSAVVANVLALHAVRAGKGGD